jgi:ribosomal protein S18 acetylase RimI-like enzyme
MVLPAGAVGGLTAADGPAARAAAGSDDAVVAAETIAHAFNMPAEVTRPYFGGLLSAPDVLLHVAELDGSIAGVCVSYRMGPEAYIHVMATDPARQGRGAGRAVIVAAMREHVAAGVERFSLLASSAGEPLYRKLGFVEIARPEFWVLNAPR